MGSSRAPWHYERFHPVERRVHFVTLDSSGRIDVFGTHLRALTDERTSPDAFVLGQQLHALAGAFVASVEVVALGESNRGRADELGIEAVNRARGIAQHAIDAHAELFELVEFLRRLQVLSLGQRFLYL